MVASLSVRGASPWAAFVLLLVQVAWPGWLGAAEPGLRHEGVTVELTAEPAGPGEVELVARFAIDPREPNLYLYDSELDPVAVGAGVPTRIEPAADSGLVAIGRLRAQPATRAKAIGGLVMPVFPTGATVTLRQRVRMPSGDGGLRSATVAVTFMACDALTGICKPPLFAHPLTVLVPTTTAAAAPPGDAAALAEVRADLERSRQAVAALAARLARLEAATGAGRIPWRTPTSRAEAERMIAEAHASGRRALLDFTGPSCVNCLVMERTVFVLPAVRAAWAGGAPIKLDTDTYPDLGRWQRETFRTEARPLYVRLDPGVRPSASAPMWAGLIARDDAAAVAGLVGFLDPSQGGGGTAPGWLGGWWLAMAALIGGLITLLMPCTYPMIPFTISFFAKQSAAGRRPVPLALAYGAGLVLCFVAVGALIVGPLGLTLAQVGGSAWVNLAVALLFVVFGLGLLGLIFLRPPAWLAAAAGGGRGGYLGALIMGLVFTVTAFTCTAPIAGSVLSIAALEGGSAWLTAVWVMAVYGATIAIPFTLLALMPGLLANLPRAGGWMEEIKLVGGLVELAAAWKFLHYCNGFWGWELDGLFGRTACLILWAVVAALIGLHLIGAWRWRGLDPIVVGPLRLLLAVLWLAAAAWLASGAAGADLGAFEALFPYADPTPV